MIKLVIASHKRADRVKTKDCFANSIICVPESQEDDYRFHNPDTEIVTHPDSVVGLAMKYVWMHKHFGDMAILGDDIEYLRRNYLKDNANNNYIIDAETAHDIVQATYQTAKNLGAKLFAFGKESNPLTYTGHRPFRLTGIASGGMIGLMKDFKLDLSPKCVSGLDYFISGLNAYFNRYMLVDDRYFTICKEGTFVSQGGMSEHRTIDSERNDMQYLKELFGEAIQIKRNENLRKKKHAYEKTLRIPF